MASKKKVLIGCFVVGCLLFIGTIGIFVVSGIFSANSDFEAHLKWAQEQQAKRKSETVGTITNYKEDRTGKYTRFHATFEYEVNGKSYSHTHLIPNGSDREYPKGKKGRVCYEQEDPTNAAFRLKVEGEVCPH